MEICILDTKRQLQYVAVFLSLCVGMIWSCSPSAEPTLQELVHWSDVVVYGKIRRTFPDPMHHYGAGTSVYTALMEVYCTMKGPEPASVINITQAGTVAGWCHSTNLRRNREYIVLLTRESHPLTSEYAATDTNLQEVAKACGVEVKYPHGINPDYLRLSCPQPVGENQCVPDPRLPPSPKPSTPKPANITTKEPHELTSKTDDKHEKPDKEYAEAEKNTDENELTEEPSMVRSGSSRPTAKNIFLGVLGLILIVRLLH